MNKKFLLFLCGAVAVFGLIFFRQMNRAGKITITPDDEPLIASELTYLPVTSTDPYLGNPGAGLTIVEYANLGCARCRELHAVFAKYVIAHPQEARLIWKNAPATGFFGNDYELAHRAGFCAEKQGKFWPFAEKVMESKKNLGENALQKIAAEVGLRLSEWWLCVNATETASAVSEMFTTARNFGFRELPAIFVNNKKISIPQDVDPAEMIKIMTKKEK